MIDVVIVAAGRGTRMQPYTFEKPKCLVPINGKPLIQHQIDTIKQFDVVNKIIIVTGYLEEKIRNYFIKQHGHVLFTSNSIYEKTECGYSMMGGINKTKNDVLCIIGDILFTKDNVMKLLYGKKSSLLIRPGTPSKLGQKVRMEGNKIKEIGLGGINSYDAEAVGPFKLTKLYVDKIKQIYDKLDIDTMENIHCYSLLGLLAKKYPFEGIWINDDEWLEVDTYEDWKLANLLYHNLLNK